MYHDPCLCWACPLKLVVLPGTSGISATRGWILRTCPESSRKRGISNDLRVGRLWSAWDAKLVGWGGLLLRSVFLYLTLNFCVTLVDVASICFFFGGGGQVQEKKPDLNHDQEGSFNPGSWLHGFQNLFSKQNWSWHSARPRSWTKNQQKTWKKLCMQRKFTTNLNSSS